MLSFPHLISYIYSSIQILAKRMNKAKLLITTGLECLQQHSPHSSLISKPKCGIIFFTTDMCHCRSEARK